MNPKVSEFLLKQKNWYEELTVLRKIMLDCGLEEEFKWRNPCYTHKGKNIALLGSFKNFCCLVFLREPC